MKSPLLIAHRGDRKYFPDNTIEGFLSAFSKGADGVEMDIQFVNEQIFLIHDYMYDKGQIYLPLSEALERLGQLGRLEIEIKAFTTEILKPLSNLLGLYSPQNVELTTSELPLIPFISHAFPQYPVGVNFNKSHWEPWMSEELYIRKTVNYLQLMKAQVAHLSNLPEDELTITLIEAIHNAGFVAHYHIGFMEMPEQLKVFKLLQDVGVDQCTFDDTDLLKEIVK
jgi:glycerophosphoryl diester phosphodiesterase